MCSSLAGMAGFSGCNLSGSSYGYYFRLYSVLAFVEYPLVDCAGAGMSVLQRGVGGREQGYMFRQFEIGNILVGSGCHLSSRGR